MTAPTTPTRLGAIESRLAAATEPLPEDARMDGYYIGFDRTGPGTVDAILSAVAIAGKGSHSTDGWNDDGGAWYYSASDHLPDADCANDLIQRTAERSATQVQEMAADLAALLAFAKEVRDYIRNPFGNAQADVTDITAALDRLEAS